MFAGIRGDRLLVKLGKERVDELIAEAAGRRSSPQAGSRSQ